MNITKNVGEMVVTRLPFSQHFRADCPKVPWNNGLRPGLRFRREVFDDFDRGRLSPIGEHAEGGAEGFREETERFPRAAADDEVEGHQREELSRPDDVVDEEEEQRPPEEASDQLSRMKLFLLGEQ